MVIGGLFFWEKAFPKPVRLIRSVISLPFIDWVPAGTGSVCGVNHFQRWHFQVAFIQAAVTARRKWATGLDVDHVRGRTWYGIDIGTVHGEPRNGVNQAVAIRVPRCLKEIPGGRIFHYPPSVHGDHRVGEFRYNAEIMGDEEEAETIFLF